MLYALASVGAGEDVRAFFDRLSGRVGARPADEPAATYAFAIDGAGDWHAVLGPGAGTLVAGAHPSPDVLVACSAEDWLALVAGELDPQLAFRTGRLLVRGDMGLAMRVRSLFLAEP